MKRQDLTGQRFGKLTVAEYVGGSKWKYKCDCGNETISFASNLKNVHTTSCGCARGNGIIGRKSGKLTVISQVDDTSYYLCKCECGQFARRSYQALVQGRAIACDDCAKKIRADAVREKVFFDGTQPSHIALDKPPTKANKSGIVGVNWDKSRGKWMASLRFKGHKYNLGRFDNIQDAIDARKEAEQQIFGDFIEWYKWYNENKKTAEDK